MLAGMEWELGRSRRGSHISGMHSWVNGGDIHKGNSLSLERADLEEDEG